MTFLPDVNVLIALAFPEHSFHARAHAWFIRNARNWATCPSTQSGFVRLAAQLSGTANRAGVQHALAALDRACQSPHHQFWPMSFDLRTLSEGHRQRLIGHGQIADLQLLALAHQQGGQLVTFDTGIRELSSRTAWEESLLVLG